MFVIGILRSIKFYETEYESWVAAESRSSTLPFACLFYFRRQEILLKANVLGKGGEALMTPGNDYKGTDCSAKVWLDLTGCNEHDHLKIGQRKEATQSKRV